MNKAEIGRLKEKLIWEYVYRDEILLLPKQLERKLNAKLAKIKRSELLKHEGELVKFLISSVNSEKYYKVNITKDYELLDILKHYRRNIKLTSIKSDINYIYGSYAKTLYMQWSNPNGKGMDVVAQELEEQGVIFNSINAVDQFAEFVKYYNNAKMEKVVKGKPIKDKMNSSELKKYHNHIIKALTKFSEPELTK